MKSIQIKLEYATPELFVFKIPCKKFDNNEFTLKIKKIGVEAWVIWSAEYKNFPFNFHFQIPSIEYGLLHIDKLCKRCLRKIKKNIKLYEDLINYESPYLP